VKSLPPELTVIGSESHARVLEVTLDGGEVGANISQREIETLPQNNRNFLAFADLAPGVSFENPDGQ